MSKIFVAVRYQYVLYQRINKRVQPEGNERGDKIHSRELSKSERTNDI